MNVTFDSTGLAGGAYNTTLDIASNDPAQPLVQVPVTLNVDSGTIVAMDYVQGTPASTVVLDVLVKNITDPSGLGAYDMRLDFDPNMIQVNGFLSGDAPFGTPFAFVINNPAGFATFNGFQLVTIPGPTADTVIVRIEIQVIGNPGDTTPLNITVIDLINADGDPIPQMDADGNLVVT